jgi:hypothetical protein
VALFRLHVFEPSEPLHDARVVGCGGRHVHLSGAQAELLRLHNEARKEHGLGTFCASEQLMSAATAHSKDMLDRGYYDHVAPDGDTPEQRVRATGYSYSSMAENIRRRSLSYAPEPTQKDLEHVFEEWMDSPGHRANLLDPDLHQIGIGEAAYGHYGTEVEPLGALHRGLRNTPVIGSQIRSSLDGRGVAPSRACWRGEGGGAHTASRPQKCHPSPLHPNRVARLARTSERMARTSEAGKWRSKAIPTRI